MLKFRLILVFILALLVVPISAKAGIICNDGWESSCSVSGPGCCSHHGGVSNNRSPYSSDYNNNYSNDDSDSSEGLVTIIFMLIIILGTPFFIGILIGSKPGGK